MTLREIVRLDRALSDVQNALGTHCSDTERARFPERHERISALWTAIEQERRALRRDRDRARYTHAELSAPTEAK